MMFSPSALAQTGGTPVTIITTQGTLSGAGRYTQSSGIFFRVVEGTPPPTSTPTPTPIPTPSPTPCIPTPGSPGGILYIGIYTLSNSENGSFLLFVQNGDNAAFGSGAPQNLPANPVLVEQGPAAVTLQIFSSGTGFGSISFTTSGSMITGTIVIASRVDIPPTDPMPCATPTPTPTPTPVGVSVSGRVLTPDGRGLRNSAVSITDSQNVRQNATTSSFGFYLFDNVRAGETYTITVTSKRYRFSPRILAINGSIANLDFLGLE